MAKSTYSFKPIGTGAGEYIETTAQETGLTKAEILRRSVLLAQQMDLFADARKENGLEGGTSMDASHMVDAKNTDPPKQEGGIRASDLAQMAPEQSRPSNDDAPQPRHPHQNRNASGETNEDRGLIEKIWYGW